MFGRAVMPARWNVARDHCADRFEPFPAHIAIVGPGFSASQSARALRRILTLAPLAPYPVATAVLP